MLTALLPALDDIDRIRENSEMDDSFKAVAAKIDKAFEKFGVEKFGEKGEDFDPTKHEAILHKPDADADKETVDTVVEAGYRIGDRVIRAARVVVAPRKTDNGQLANELTLSWLPLAGAGSRRLTEWSNTEYKPPSVSLRSTALASGSQP